MHAKFIAISLILHIEKPVSNPTFSNLYISNGVVEVIIPNSLLYGAVVVLS